MELDTSSSPLISPADVEQELLVLFGGDRNKNLVVRVQGAAHSADRSDAFQELLHSLALYNPAAVEAHGVAVEPPDARTITRALLVIADKKLQHRLFEYILSTFGRKLVDPLAEILDSGKGGPLYARMQALRSELLDGVQDLRLTQETRSVLEADLTKFLGDDYLAMLAEHEEQVQRPRVKKLAQEVLHLVGVTFQSAFRRWPEHAEHLGHSISHSFSGTGRIQLGEHPVLIRRRITQGIAEFLWVETSSDLRGALAQLFAQRAYAGLVGSQEIELARPVYNEFAEACWQLVAEYC
jgi:hypothetical protein